MHDLSQSVSRDKSLTEFSVTSERRRKCKCSPQMLDGSWRDTRQATKANQSAELAYRKGLNVDTQLHSRYSESTTLHQK
jgi:hypothetical protein